MLSEKKRKFAQAKLLNKDISNREAAIAAGYSEKTAGPAGSRLAKDKEVLAEIERKGKVKQAKADHSIHDLSKLAGNYSDPKAFLKAMMNDGGEDPKLRLAAAQCLMPYVHEKKGSMGKKEQQQKDAESLSTGRFATSAPPKLQ